MSKRKDFAPIHETPETQAAKIHRLDHVTDDASLYYSEKTARAYTTTSNEGIQHDMTSHALDMILCVNDVEPTMMLDVGCGSGLSLKTIRTRFKRTVVIGLDVSPAMLNLAKDRESQDHLVLASASKAFPFCDGVYDSVISISAIQWLCVGDTVQATQRLSVFFQSLFRVLTSEGRAILQVYPQTLQQTELLVECARNNSFKAEFLMDYPHKVSAKKWFLAIAKNAAASRSRKCSCCPLATRFQAICALNYWREARSTVLAQAHIERLEKEHVDFAHQVLRVSRRAEKLRTELDGTPTRAIHPKEMECLNMLAFEKAAAEAVTLEFGIDATKSDLARQASRLCDILHH